MAAATPTAVYLGAVAPLVMAGTFAAAEPFVEQLQVAARVVRLNDEMQALFNGETYSRLYAFEGELWLLKGDEQPVPVFVTPGDVNDTLDGGRWSWRPAPAGEPFMFALVPRVVCHHFASTTGARELPGPTQCRGVHGRGVGLLGVAAIIVTGGAVTPFVVSDGATVNLDLSESRAGAEPGWTIPVGAASAR